MLFTYPQFFSSVITILAFTGAQFLKFWVPLELQKVKTQPAHVLQTYSLCQSTSFDPKNLMEKELE